MADLESIRAEVNEDGQPLRDWRKLPSQDYNQREVNEKVLQKSADNATLAKLIQYKLLLMLDVIIDAFPANSTEYRETNHGNVYVWKFTDITRAYRDLTDSQTTGSVESPLLKALYELEKSRRPS